MDENASRDVKQIIYEVYATADALGKKEGVSLSLMQLRPLRISIPLETLGESFDRNQELEADLDELRMLRQSDRYQVYKLSEELMKLGYQRLLIGYMWLKGYTQPEIARELDTTIHVVRSNIDSFESAIRKATYSDRYDIASALASGMALATLLQRRKEDRDFDRLGKELRERARTEAAAMQQYDCYYYHRAHSHAVAAAYTHSCP